VDTLLPGITAERMPTSRLTVNVLSLAGPPPGRTGPPVLFVHGNVSSSLFWQPMMLALPEPYQPLAIDLRGFGDTDDEPIDATRGLRDFSDDLAATVEALGLDRVHLVGWSMGGGVVLQYLVDRPGPVASLTLVDPVSPFGFGGTRGVDGILCDPYGAGSGGGAANPEFVERLAGKDRTDNSPLSPRQVLLAHYVKPPHVPEHLDIFVESMLSTRTGEWWYPGDSRPVDAWPGFAPGDRGVLNTMAPTHFRIADLSGVDPKPPVLWIRGRHRLRHVPVRPGLPGLARRDPRLARRANLAPAAHGGADQGRAERLRGGRRPLPRGSHRGRGPRPAPGPAGAVPGRTDQPSRQRLITRTRRSQPRRRDGAVRRRRATRLLPAGRPSCLR
jgi:pimeloyl-ACP methyl ester carboxylesterase